MAALDEVVNWARRFREAELPFMLVGAYAVAAHGLPRASGDIDLVVHLPFSERGRVRTILEGERLADIHERVDEVWGKRVAADLPSGLTLEVFFTPPHPVHDREYARRVIVKLRGEEIPVISPEDLILRKLVNIRYRRGLDYDDALGVLARQGNRIDLAYLRAHAGFYRVQEHLERAINEAATAEPGASR